MPHYVPCCVLANGTPVPIELKAENEFRLTAEELEAAITPKTKLLVMPFPNNPTGAVMEKKDLEAVAEVVKKHDLFVLSDEIYAELTYLDNHFCGGIYARFGCVPVFAHSCGLVSGGVFFLQTSGEKRQNYAYHQGTNERLMGRKKGSLSAPFFVGKIL